jgi:hypothetical protein
MERSLYLKVEGAPFFGLFKLNSPFTNPRLCNEPVEMRFVMLVPSLSDQRNFKLYELL